MNPHEVILSLNKVEARLLYWRCKGWTYSRIVADAGRTTGLNYSQQSLSIYMARIYSAMGLSHRGIDKNEKWRIVRETYCPVLMYYCHDTTDFDRWPPPRNIDVDPMALTIVMDEILEEKTEELEEERIRLEEERRRLEEERNRRALSPPPVYVSEPTPPRVSPRPREDYSDVAIPRRRINIGGIISTLVIIAVCAGCVYVLPDIFTSANLALPSLAELIPPTRTLTVSPTLGPTNTPPPPVFIDLPFVDEFETDIRPEWEIWSQPPTISNGNLTTTTATWLCLWDLTWQDVYIEFKTTSSNMTVAMRAQNGNDFIGFDIYRSEVLWDICTGTTCVHVPETESRVSSTNEHFVTLWVKDYTFRSNINGEDGPYFTLSEDLRPTFQKGGVLVHLMKPGGLEYFRVRSAD